MADGGKGERERREGKDGVICINITVFFVEMSRFKKNEYFVVMLCTLAVTNSLERWNCSIRSGFVSWPVGND